MQLRWRTNKEYYSSGTGELVGCDELVDIEDNNRVWGGYWHLEDGFELFFTSEKVALEQEASKKATLYVANKLRRLGQEYNSASKRLRNMS